MIVVKSAVFPPFFSLLEPDSSMCLDQHVQKGLLTSAARSKFVEAHRPPFLGWYNVLLTHMGHTV